MLRKLGISLLQQFLYFLLRYRNTSNNGKEVVTMTVIALVLLGGAYLGMCAYDVKRGNV